MLPGTLARLHWVSLRAWRLCEKQFLRAFIANGPLEWLSQSRQGAKIVCLSTGQQWYTKMRDRREVEWRSSG